MRSCGTCDMCCNGTFSLPEINGHRPEPTKPCYFLNVVSKCTIYEDRPNPCKSYQCLWLADESIPDFMKPENMGGILDIGKFKEYTYLQLNTNNVSYSDESMEFSKSEADKRKMNLIIQANGVYSYYGDRQECLQILKEQFGVELE